ncbi:lipocalin family protein [Xylophilus sp. ASV27]|uniref:lipocalin family protein n=1 Tax=Xylophilus sp. ASV27 TaxID=2795129 RepID=UPI0018EDD2B0|nr:lipocalin family protein [Xylophilus sp. ASV27]
MLAALLAAGLLSMGVLRDARAQGTNALSGTLPVVPHLDLLRYGGLWHEIARLPNSFQRKCVEDVTAEYQPRPEGGVSVVNRCRQLDGSLEEARGVARRVPPREGEADDAGRLEVRFAPAWMAWLPAVWGDYSVLALDDDYSISLVGTADRNYLWLLARRPSLPDPEVDAWLARAAALGFDTSRVIRSGPIAGS